MNIQWVDWAEEACATGQESATDAFVDAYCDSQDSRTSFYLFLIPSLIFFCGGLATCLLA